MNVSASNHLASFAQLVKNSTQRFAALPTYQQWNEYYNLVRGKAILQHPIQLDAYNALFANLHYAKLTSLFDDFLSDKLFDTTHIRVIDYGCGQGLASLVLQERNKHLQLYRSFNELLLIEPSSLALQQAAIHNAHHYANITSLNKHFAQLHPSDLLSNAPVSLHLFSNVLDMDTIDIEQLVNCIKQGISGTNIFVCCSPDFVSGNARLDYFYNQLNPDKGFCYREQCEAQTFDMKTQYLSTRMAKCYARVFVCYC